MAGNATLRWERVSSLILTCAAIVLTSVVVRRELLARDRASSTTASARWTFIEEWESALPMAHSYGPPDASVHLVEFSDLECPFCRQWHMNLDQLLGDDKARVRYSFVHYPLARHANARPAAQAVECARRQGRFSEYVDAIFKQQDSLGAKSYSAFAREASVADTVAFQSCLRDSTSFARVDAGAEVARRLGLRLTPTIFVNGWQAPSSGRDTAVANAVRGLLRGEDPFKSGRE